MLALYLAMLERPEDEAAFTERYDRYTPLLTREAEKFFRGNTGHEDDAVQLTWEAVAKHFVKLSALPRQEFVSYLVIIVRNKCRDILRKEKRHWEYRESSWIDATVLRGDTAETVHAREEHRDLLALFRTLREPYREVMERRLMLEESNREVARAMGVDPALASKWYERARAMLAGKLQGGEVHHA